MRSATLSLSGISVWGLHGSTNLDLQLQQGLNILFGRNGTGKTTLLHILANLLEGDIERFTYLRFERIRVSTVNEGSVELLRRAAGESTVIEVQLDGTTIGEVKRGDAQNLSIRKALAERLGSKPVYLPAFRSVLEASSRRRADAYGPMAEELRREISRLRELEGVAAPTEPELSPPPMQLRGERLRTESTAYKSLLCRQWFGSFVPWVRFASLAEVGEQLVDEFQAAEIVLAQKDRAAFSDVFVKVLRTIFQGDPVDPPANTTTTLGAIRQHLESLQEVSPSLPSVYNALSAVVASQGASLSQERMAATILELYSAALEERVAAQRESFERLKLFQDSLNRFLAGKALTVGWRPGTPGRRISARLLLEDGRLAPLSTLSSGERHVLTMLFSATHMADTDGMILIDEPELSLHVDWQRTILGEMMAQAGGRQVLACTHAPEVAAEHRPHLSILKTSPYQEPQQDLFRPDDSGAV